MAASSYITIGSGLASSYVLCRSMGYAVGHVHSVFDSCLNVLIEDELIHVGALSKGLSCLGFAVDDDSMVELTRQAHVGDRVVVAGDVLRIYTDDAVSSIPFKFFTPVSTLISPHSDGFDPSTLALELSLLELERRTGIVPDVQMQSTAEVLASPDASIDDLRASMNYLIGRGAGLTPSGDDLLVGYGVARHLLKRAETFCHVLSECLTHASTTDVSRAYLKAISKGYANHSYLELADSAISRDGRGIARALDTLLKVGHTSGADGLLGFALGIGLNLLASRPVAAYGGG